MSGRRQQTAEGLQTAAAEAVYRADRALRALRSADGSWHVSAPPLSLEAREFSLDPGSLPVWKRPAVISASILNADAVPGLAMKFGFLRRRAIGRAGEWLANNQAGFRTAAVAEALQSLGLPLSNPAQYAAVRETAVAALALGEAAPLAGKCSSGYATESLPDADTAAAVLLATADRSGVQWLLDRQSSDGGWAAFDAKTEPSAPDVTGHVLEALTHSGPHDATERAVEYVFRVQAQDGSWQGVWGVNYIYGTFRVLRGLRAAGVSDREAPVLRAGEWLRSIQNADGGWGESAASYAEGTYVPAESTPSQTAWAILGLLAGGDETSLSVNNGIQYLVDTQIDDGTWDEHAPTSALVPCGSLWSNPLYRISFPLLALSSYLKSRREVAH